MKTLLLNGCSYGKCWTPSDKFVSSLGCDTHVNISKYATSFQRSCRTTIEWIAKNGKPEYVIIPMTFAHRWELSLSYVDEELDGGWIPLQNSNYLRDEFELHPNSFDDIKKLVAHQGYDPAYGARPLKRVIQNLILDELALLMVEGKIKDGQKVEVGESKGKIKITS